MNKKTLVIGASENPERYAHKAVLNLLSNGYSVEAIGQKVGNILSVAIQTGFPYFSDIHTVTLYINPKVQEKYYEYLLSLHPKRVIFNPGTENKILQQILVEKAIEWEEACTLVLLSLKKY